MVSFYLTLSNPSCPNPAEPYPTVGLCTVLHSEKFDLYLTHNLPILHNPCLQYCKGKHYTAPPLYYYPLLLPSSWPFTQSAACCIPMHPKPLYSSTQPYPTFPYPTLPYPNLSYTTPIPPNPWVAHSMALSSLRICRPPPPFKNSGLSGEG